MKLELASRALVYFASVAKHGSIRGAATVLNISASAVNRQILDLEASMGVALFQRLPRGMRLTTAGELLLAYIQRTNRDFDVVKSQIEELQGLRRGTVRIALIEAVAEATAEQIAIFRQQHPKISFEFKVMGSVEVLAAVAREEFDLGIAFNPPADRKFYTLAETRQTLCAVMARNHPLAERDGLRLSDCLESPILLGDRSFGGRSLLDAMADGTTINLQPIVVGNSIAAMEIIVAASEAICFQIEIGARTNEIIIARRLRDPSLTGRLVLGMRRGRQLPAIAAVLIETLRATLFS
ncbi:LysR family transcriptional regulator [Oryzifoliimicrobium ureilyticus]|uniref:LysR family transcriptional regulator n=1 Tax=Oryzifoliimicrobium ureilyticus TaxID=3113724 RepID=UPI0030763450